MIFVDSDAYIALHVEKDIHHLKSIRLMEKLKNLDEQLITSWQVIDEVATKLSYFTTKNNAMEFLRSLLKGGTKIEYIDSSISVKVIALFAKQTSKRVSLTDCANMAIAGKLGLEIFLSFDDHYRQNGFRLFGD